MSSPTVIVITNAQLLLGDTSADVIPPTGTGSGENFSCQVTDAAINATPNLQKVPATFCVAESQVPAATGYELAITWLQDWTAAAGGLSMYAFDNDTLAKYFSLCLVGTADPIASGQVRIVAGAFGGTAATPLTAQAVWPVIGKPTISASALAVASAAPEYAA